MFTLNVIKCSLLFLNLPSNTSAGVALVDLKCTPNPLYCKDTICILNRTVDMDKPKLVHITFGCTLIKEVPKLLGNTKLFVKKNKKYVRVGNNMNVEMDFCKISTILTSPVLTTFVPQLTAQVAATFHECPYSGVFLVDKFSYDGQRIRTIPGWKNTKSEVTFTRGSYVPLLRVDFYATAD